MGKKAVVTGNKAAALAVKYSRAEVIAAYPITPQTTVVEYLSEYVESGELKAKFIRVESEHSAMAATIGAALAGARAFTASSSQGLLYMYEPLLWASFGRVPLVYGIICRTVFPPWNIWSDHFDALTLKDAGWILMFSQSNQEIFDNIIQAFRISEDERVLLPVAVAWDGFVASHTAEPIELPEQEDVDRFLPPRKPLPWTINFDKPEDYSPLMMPDDTFLMRYAIIEAMENAKKVIREVGKEFGKIFGRYYDLVETYRVEDADYILFAMGAPAGDALYAVDILRERGYKAGLVKVRVFRPFPTEVVREMASKAKAFIVIDRNYMYGTEGALASNIKWALYNLAIKGVKVPPVYGLVAGVGGKDIDYMELADYAEKAIKAFEEGEVWDEPVWVGLEKLLESRR